MGGGVCGGLFIVVGQSTAKIDPKSSQDMVGLGTANISPN